MSGYFSELQTFLLSDTIDDSFANTIISQDSLIERIRQVLINKPFYQSDVKPLIRHLLLRESSRSNHDVNIRVPKNKNWPSVDDWLDYGIIATSVESDLLLVAKKWNPDWLDVQEGGVFSDAFSEKKVREDGKCQADPFVEDVTGYRYYSSPGQREAIRSAFLIPNGDTLIINLPTGSGKSLVGQIPALVKKEGSLTLFVVPTIALAIDQARQMQKYFKRTENTLWPLAWYGGLNDEERTQIRQRINAGTQRILFTSPEALTTSLLNLVFIAAENGFLRYLVIDEAHLITQWGDEFRPAFQALAGLRNSLLRLVNKTNKIPFRTLLLSATYTPETIDTLANLFGPEDKVQMIAAVHTRPEPQYWCKKVNDEEEKIERVLEALRYAPRPFILYVTKRQDAHKWHNLLKSKYQRIDRFDGSTNDNKRKKIIDAWVANKLDGIVATSAFGVGMDKGDVRAIIHAAIPETLDRFYQEVGRGGRDGSHSISLLIYKNEDWLVAASMSNPRLISEELGLSRWSALYNSRNNYNDSTDEFFRVDLDAVRDGLIGSNEENVRWNMRTLLLMARAGFIELDIVPNRENNLDDKESNSLISIMSVVRIKLLKYDHLLAESWDIAVGESREKTLKSGQRNLELLKSMIENGVEISEVLSDLYRNRSPNWLVNVTKVCGGCYADRMKENRNTHYHVPVSNPVNRIIECNPNVLIEKFPYLNLKTEISVFYDLNTQQSEIINVIKWLIKMCGVQEVYINENSTLANDTSWKKLYQSSPSGIVLHYDLKKLQNDSYLKLGRVTLFDRQVNAVELDNLLMLNQSLHLVFYPSETVDPMNSNRKLAELDRFSNQITIQNIIEEIGI